ncbi:fimbria/pilus outer membrane usher protein [Lysobacter fragariae]
MPVHRKSLAFAVGAALVACAATASAGTGTDAASISLGELDLPEIGSAPGAAANDQPLYLEVYFDERPRGQLVQVRLRDGRLHATVDELKSIGIVVDPALASPADGLVALDAVPGLAYRYDVPAQRLIFTLAPTLRPNQALGYRAPQPVEASRGTGLLLNYDAYARRFDGHDTASLATLLRGFGRFGAIETSALSRAGDGGGDAYQRLDTRWTWSDPARMTTWTAGDLISGGLGWTRPVRLGGLQWRRNFGVRPDLITFPVPHFAGQATVPSSVELLVNNVQQFGAEVDDGPFVLDTFPHLTGSGEATLVVRDVLGRATRTSVPIYVDHQRLAPGLSDFSLEAGQLRLGYGGDNDRYADDLTASGSYRRGVSNAVTLEAHAEYGPDLRVGGLGAVWAPGGYLGVVTAALARSDGLAQGSQRTVGYQWMSPKFGIDLQAQRRSRGFRDLGDLADGGNEPTSLRAEDRASMWWSIPRGSIALSWLHWRNRGGDTDRINTLSWSQVIGRELFASLNVFDSGRTGRGVSLNLNLPLGRQRDASLSVSRSHGNTDTVAALRQSAPYDGGWGWDLQAGDSRGGHALASANVRGRHGEAAFGADHSDGRNGYFAQGSGSLVWMGAAAFASRRVGDAFAVVDARIGGVPVLYENREFGRTNARGYVLLTDLRGWQRNRIAIDPDGLGVGYRLPPLEQLVTPADSGAVMVSFDVARTHPALVTLLDRAGQPAPAGSRGTVAGSGAEFLVGLDGEAYVDDLPDGGTLELELASGRCRYPLPSGRDASGVTRLDPQHCQEAP